MVVNVIVFLGGVVLGWFLARKFGGKADDVIKTINQ
jgi:uncharacterized protein YneF (UPF0154 family)